MTFELGIGHQFWLVGLLMSFFVGVTIYELRSYYAGKASYHWHTIQAVVTKAIIQVRHDEDGIESMPKVKYNYQFKGRKYTGNRIQYGNLWSVHYEHSCELIRGIKPGSSIKIKINPKNPSQSTIYEGYSGHILPVIGAAILALFFIVRAVSH